MMHGTVATSSVGIQLVRAEILQEWPFVSVIMPVRNEGRHIARSLRAVLAQDYPADRYEIIVADGMSTDDTRAAALSLRQSLPSLTVIENPAETAACGLNRATSVARGDVIVRVDGHCEIAPNYLRACVEHLRGGQADGVGGPVRTVGRTPVAHAIAVAMSSSFGVGDSAFRTVKDRTLFVDTIAFPAYPREVVEWLGPYDEELVRNQDDEYNYRLRQAGGQLLLAADVRSQYYSRTSLRSLWRQYFGYGLWKVRVMQKHPAQMRRRQFVPVLFVTALLVSASAACCSAWGGALLLAVLGTYGAANIAASLLAARGDSWRTRLMLPGVFAILHVAYGCGFLLGLARFAACWRETVLRRSPPVWQRPRHAK